MQGVNMVHPPDSTGQSWLQGDEEKAAESSFVIFQLFDIFLTFRPVRGRGRLCNVSLHSLSPPHNCHHKELKCAAHSTHHTQLSVDCTTDTLITSTSHTQ